MFEKQNIQETVNELKSDAVKGLTDGEAFRRLQQNGRNEMKAARKKTKIQLFLEQLKDPLIYILLIAAVVSVFLGELSDAVIIGTVVVVNALVGMLQAEGPAGDAYRKRKLLEHYLEPVALKGDLKVADVRLLLCLCEKHEWDSRRELADFAGISRTNLTSGLQRLTMKGFLKIEEVKEPKPSRKSKAAGEVQGKAEKPETRRKDRG